MDEGLMPKALKLNYDVIRGEFALGMTIKELAKKHNCGENVLKQRSRREKWMEFRPETHLVKSDNKVAPHLVDAAKNVAQTWLEKGENYRKLVFDKAAFAVENANLTPPKNWKDAEIADKIARRAAGLDNLETQINTIIGVGNLEDAPIRADFEAEFVNNVSIDSTL